MSEIKLNHQMNAKIKDILRITDEPTDLYAAARIEDLESHLAQANKKIGEQIRDMQVMGEFEENQAKKLVKAREEIEKSHNSLTFTSKENDALRTKLSKAEEQMATIRHDLRLTQDAHIEALGERDNLTKAVNMQTDLYRAELVKNEKLERVREAAEKIHTLETCEHPFFGCELGKALAALRETEGKA